MNKFLLKNYRTYKKKNFKTYLWFIINYLIFNSFLPFSNFKILILRAFGAKIGKNVILKNFIRIKNPENLIIYNNVWIGEGVWIDNIAKVIINENTCISQGVYFCTGNHDRKKVTFDLIEKPIVVGKNCWIAAKCIIGPGAKIKNHSFYEIGNIIK